MPACSCYRPKRSPSRARNRCGSTITICFLHFRVISILVYYFGVGLVGSFAWTEEDSSIDAFSSWLACEVKFPVFLRLQES